MAAAEYYKSKSQHVLQFLNYLQTAKALHPKIALCNRASLAQPLKNAFGIPCTGGPFHLVAISHFSQNASTLSYFSQWSLNSELNIIHMLKLFGIKPLRWGYCPWRLYFQQLWLPVKALLKLLSFNARETQFPKNKCVFHWNHGFFKNHKLERAQTTVKFPCLNVLSALCSKNTLKLFLRGTKLLLNDFIFAHPSQITG